jgi:hypothetical protein
VTEDGLTENAITLFLARLEEALTEKKSNRKMILPEHFKSGKYNFLFD